MSPDSQLTPWPETSLPHQEPDFLEPKPTPRLIPHLGHVLVFLGILGVSYALVWLALILAIGMHLFGKFPITELQKNTFILVGMLAVIYGMTAGLTTVIMPHLWDRSMAEGISWQAEAARKRLAGLVGLGAGVSLIVELLSNYLPIPKGLPIDDFFKTSTSIWTVAFFGVFIAPFFEELAFRGFLLPALANAWDWLALKFANQKQLTVDPNGQPQWSLPAMIFASLITSIGFATIHSEQLAHSWAPLAVLYCVSLVLCAVRFWSRSLAASSIVHAAYNLTLFATIFFATGGFRHLEKIQS